MSKGKNDKIKVKKKTDKVIKFYIDGKLWKLIFEKERLFLDGVECKGICYQEDKIIKIFDVEWWFDNLCHELYEAITGELGFSYKKSDVKEQTNRCADWTNNVIFVMDHEDMNIFSIYFASCLYQILSQLDKPKMNYIIKYGKDLIKAGEKGD